MTPDQLFELPAGTVVVLNGWYFARRDVPADSGQPEFEDQFGVLYDAEDLDGADTDAIIKKFELMKGDV